MNTKTNAKGAITAITHANATSELGLQYSDPIIPAARTVDKGVVDVKENESWEWLKIHTVLLIRYMGNGTEGPQMMRDEFEAENKGIVIPTQVRWLANARAIMERRQNGEMAVSLVVFVIKGSKVAQTLVEKGIKEAGVWYRVETSMNEGPDSWCELCCGCGHIEIKCSGKDKCAYCSGHHRTNNQKSIMVGCTAKQGSLCGHTLEKCRNCKGNHIAFSSRCVKKREATESAQLGRKIGLAGRASERAARDMATGSNREVLGPTTQGVAGGEGDEGEIADGDEEEEAAGEARDLMMAEIDTATRTVTDTETETELGVLATSDQCDPAQLRKAI